MGASVPDGSGTEPEAALTGPSQGKTKVTPRVTSVDHSSIGPGRLRNADLRVLRTSTAASSVMREIMNHDVWNRGSPAGSTQISNAKASRSRAN